MASNHAPKHSGPEAIAPQDIPGVVPIPEPAIKAVAIALALVVALVALSQWTGVGQPNGITVDADQRYALLFSDGDEGAIEVSDPVSAAVVHRFESEETGFIRVALKALIFDRERAGIGQDQPFHLLTTEAGPAYLLDPATGEFVALSAFGDGNGAQFAPLIEAARTAGIGEPAAGITLKGDPV